MADYPLTPVALSTIDATLPTGSEDASKIDEVCRQTRHIFKQLLDVIMADDGTLKEVSNIADNAITVDKLATGAVSDVKLKQTGGSEAVVTAAIRDNAVSSAKLGSSVSVDSDRAVGTNHIKDAAVTSPKIAAGGVGTTNLAALAVTDAILASHVSTDASRAVGTNHIKDLNVTEAKLANSAVSAAKMKSAGSGNRMIWDNASSVEALEIDTTGDIIPAKVSSKLKFSFAAGKGDFLGNTAIIVERGGSSAAAGGSANDNFTVRPVGAGGGNTDFVELYDPNSLVSFIVVNDSGNKKRIVFANAGTYYVELRAAAYKSGSHFARLVDKTAFPNVILLETGPNNLVTSVSDSSQDFTSGYGIITIAANATQVQLEHWTHTAKATDGLGTPITDGSNFPASNNTYVFMFITRLT